MKEQVSLYRNLKGNNKLKDVSIKDVINLIIDSHPHKDLIGRLRQLHLLNQRNSPEFDKIKIDLLPAFTPNALMLDGQKSDMRVKDLSGIMYIDLDSDDAHTDAFQLKLNPSTLLVFKSCSGKGYGALIRVKGLSGLQDFKEQQKALYKNLGLDYDKNALGASRGCVLSYDPNAFYNPNAIEMDLTHLNGPKKSKDSKSVRLVCIEGSPEQTNTFSTKIYFSTQLSKEMYNEFGYCVIPEGHPYTRPHLFNVKEGERNTRVSAYIYGIVWNNPQITLDRLTSHVWTQVKSKNIGLSYGSVLGMCKSVYANKHNQAPPQTLKKVFFDQDLKWTKESKQNISRIEIGKLRNCDTKQRIQAAINDLSALPGKITQDTVSQHLGLSKMTIRRYWPEFKDQVKEINKRKKYGKV